MSQTRRSGPLDVSRPTISSVCEPSAARTIRALPEVSCSCVTNAPALTIVGPDDDAAGAGAGGAGAGLDSVSVTVRSVTSFHGWNQ